MSGNSPLLHSAMERHPDGQVRVYSVDGELVTGTSCAGYLAALKATRMATTVEALDAIPTGVAVLTEQGGIWVAVHQSGGMNNWLTLGDPNLHLSSDLSLPARVLDHLGDL